MSDQGEQSAIPAPRYRVNEQVILLFVRQTWPAMVVEYRGYHTDSQGKSDHYYRVLFRRTENRDSMRLSVPECYLLPRTLEAEG